MSKVRWQKLSAEQQHLIRRAAKASVPYMRQQWDQRVLAAQAKVFEAGAQVIDDPELSAFVEAMQPVYQQFVTTETMRDLVERIQAVQVVP